MNRRRILLFLICVFGVCIIVGCTTPTQDNPFGISDPNGIQSLIIYGVGIGQGMSTTGAATMNPYLLAYGAGLVLIGGIATSILFPKKKEGENNGSGTT